MSKKQQQLKIAILGTRGVPANYGGFETFAEEVALEFLKSGHEVTVYARKKFYDFSKTSWYQGIRVVRTSTIFHKYLETPLSSLTACLDACFRGYDVILICNAANSPFAWILKSTKAKIAINVDGIERRRTKWNSLGRLWYRLGEKASSVFADRVVADANVIADYYREKHNTESTIIRYGARVKKLPPGKVMAEFNLQKDRYILYVSRLEPENNALGTIEAYVKANPEIPLVVVGDAPYADEYKEKLKQAANQNVIFTGFQFGDAYKELRSNCLFYVQATEVGGTHPALVEAIAYGNCIVANQVPEHDEVLEDAGLYYPLNDFDALAEIMQNLMANPDQIESYKAKAARLAEEKFLWSRIAAQYEDLFFDLLKA